MANVQLAVAGDETTQVILSVPGVQGPAGSNLPPSGTTHQLLYKQSSTDYDTGWKLITNDNVDASAAIAGTKISPDFGSQNVLTTGTSTAASFIPTSSSVPTNGLYLPSANNVAISTSGTGRLFVDANGNVGVGITPSSWSAFTALQVQRASVASTGDDLNLMINAYYDGSDYRRISTTSVARQYFNSDGSLIWSQSGSGAANSTITFNERMRLDSSGRLGLGTSSPGQGQAQINITAAGAADISAIALNLTNNSTSAGTGVSLRFSPGNVLTAFRGSYINSVISGSNGSDLQFWTCADGVAPGQRMTIDPAGNVGIGTTSPGATLHVEGSELRVKNGTGVPNITLAGRDTDGTAVLAFQNNGSSANNATLTATTNTLAIATGGSERARIDSSGTFRVKGAGTAGVNDAVQLNGSAPANSLLLDASGRLLVGTSSARNNYYNSTGVTTPRLQVEGTDYSGSSFSLTCNNSNTVGGFPMLVMAKSAGSSVGSNTAVTDGHVLGQVTFQGNDGAEFVVGADITAYVDGTPGANDMPGRLVFSVTADGASSPTERLRITSAGVLQVADAGNITVGTTTGTKIGTATTQKLGFFNATPVVQPAAVADATDAATVITQLNDLLAKLRTLGIIAT